MKISEAKLLFNSLICTLEKPLKLIIITNEIVFNINYLKKEGISFDIVNNALVIEVTIENINKIIRFEDYFEMDIVHTELYFKGKELMRTHDNFEIVFLEKKLFEKYSKKFDGIAELKR